MGHETERTKDKVRASQRVDVGHAAASHIIKNGRKPKFGETVRRKSDGKLFKVQEVNAFGIKLEGHTDLFEPSGFTVL